MHQPLFVELEATMLNVCRASLAKNAGEHFYCVALFTSREYRYLADSVATFEGLEQVARKYLKDKYYQDTLGTIDVAMRKLKWSPCDSPHHCEFVGDFNSVDEILDSMWSAVAEDSHHEYVTTCKNIHDTCIAVLSKVRDSGLFDKKTSGIQSPHG